MKKFSVNTEGATLLYSQILKKSRGGSIKPTLSLNSLLKAISALYIDRLKSSQNTMNPFYVIIYDSFLHRYGLKKVTEHKFVQILETSLCYQENIRILNFSKLCQVHPDPWDKDIGNFYFEMIKILDESSSGISVAASTLPSVYIPYNRCLECSQRVFSTEIINDSIETFDSLKKEILIDHRRGLDCTLSP